MSVGSSPLARGLRISVAGVNVENGIIPARAGFTLPLSQGDGCAEDHPRSRGVYYYTAWPWVVDTGSSPLARGLLRKALYALLTAGIIPARAGFTSSSSANSLSGQDHPRSRGVYRPAFSSAAVGFGSSPVARGLQPIRAPQPHADGIIPARAGFTHHNVVALWADPDHPRSRGVYQGQDRPCRAGRGSSPLARGLQVGVADLSESDRIIPARAGVTSRAWNASRFAWDHPRSRGVYTWRSA